jgi:hypothetical protein
MELQKQVEIKVSDRSPFMCHSKCAHLWNLQICTLPLMLKKMSPQVIGETHLTGEVGFRIDLCRIEFPIKEKKCTNKA